MDTNRKPIDPADMFFVLTNDGRLGMGYCYDKEAGGLVVVKWVPESMVKIAAAAILDPKD